MNTGSEEEFVGIDVADTGDDSLVAEQGLDGGGALGNAGLKHINGEVGAQRLRAEASQKRIRLLDQPDLAQLARVDKAEFAASSRM